MADLRSLKALSQSSLYVTLWCRGFCKVNESCCPLSKMGNKFTIPSHKSTHFPLCCGHWIWVDCLHLPTCGLTCPWPTALPRYSPWLCATLHLLELMVRPENMLQVSHILFLGLARNNHIIQVRRSKKLWNAPQQQNNKSLKSCWYPLQNKWHHLKLKQAKRCFESC